MASAKDNPLYQVPYSVARGVKKNTATLHFSTTRTDLFTRQVVKSTYTRTIAILDVEPVNEYLVSQGIYLDGDLKCYFPALALEKAIAQTNSDDPQGMTLKAIRTFNASNGGLEIGKDSVVFNNDEYTITKIEPCNVWNNMPNKFKITMRRISTSNHS